MNSWDVFDTLIARLHFHPTSIFDEVGKRIGDPSFKDRRVAAWKQVKKTCVDKTYNDIYNILVDDDPQIELDVEFEHNFPIYENLMKVKDGDLLISDMYLPAEFIMKMLRNAGLTADVNIVVTADGKKKGWVWDEIKSKYSIENHYGDNEKSDVASANKHGINGILYTGYKLNDIENFVYKYDRQLALWMRSVRLMCPFNDERHIKFWNDQANINLPVLALATLELPDTPIAFTYRDCYNWQKIYETMTGKQGYRLDVSRKMYLGPNDHFKKYMSFVKENNATIVDLQGKGRSIQSFYNGNPPSTIYIGGRPPPYVKRLVNYQTKSMEKHNCFEEGPIMDYDEHGPVRGANDHPQDVADIHKKAGQAAVRYINKFKFKNNLSLLTELVRLYDTHNFTNKNVKWAKYNNG
jgi:hypothetical protein